MKAGFGMFPTEEVLTASQVARLLKIHPRTVYHLARKGSIPARKLGGSWRFRKDAILKMVPGGEGVSGLINGDRYVDKDD